MKRYNPLIYNLDVHPLRIRCISRYSRAIGKGKFLDVDIPEKGHKVKKNSGFTPITFCNIVLTPEAKQDYLLWEQSEGIDSDELLAVLVGTGFKMSLSYNDDKKVFNCSVTCKDDQNQNADKCVTSRGATLHQAMTVALYKHFVLLDDADWAEYSAEDDWG